MCERRRWDLYVRDMLQACERGTAYTAGMDQTDFLSDRRTYDATLRNLELVGEAATRIPAAVRDAHAGVPWRDVIGTRNRIIHGYLGIDDDLIWGIVCQSVPELTSLLRALLEEADGTGPGNAAKLATSTPRIAKPLESGADLGAGAWILTPDRVGAGSAPE